VIPWTKAATEAGDDGAGTADQARLFDEFHLDERVPAGHLLRRIDVFVAVALGDLRQIYSHTGRPSIDPELLIRMLIVGYCYGMRSERRLSEEVADQLTFRWFCRLGLDDKVPDHSTFYSIRHGRFRDSDVLRHVFERVVLACCTAGLVGGEDFAVDASLIEPDADKGRSIPRAEWRQERSCHSEPRREGVSGDARRRCLRRSYRGHPEVRLALRSRRAMDWGDEERRLFRLGGVMRHH
jgi:transposase